MGWLRKAQSIPPFPAGGVAVSGPGTVQGQAFLDFIGGRSQELYPEPNFANNADYGFDKNELVYACIMAKATSLPEAPFRVFAPDGQGEPRESHPLRQLMANPNGAMTEFEMLELTSIYLDLAGVAFWEIVTNRVDQPVELWPLRPDLVRIYPKKDGKHRYGYALGNSGIVDLGTNVLKFTLPNPMHPWLGQAPMRPANRAVALDNEATDFVKTLLQNHAVPGTIIETEQKIDEALTERLTAKWMERFGRGNRGTPAFLQKGMKVHPLGLDLTQLEFPDLRTIAESRICMSFGVPPILVGAKVGLDRSTFANFAEARRSFWEDTLMPLQKRMQQVIVNTLMPMVEGPRPRRSVAKFDNSQVLALREAEGKRWELATNALRAGAITINQFNRYVGMPSVPDGDVYLRPAGVVPTDVEGNVVAERPAITLTQPAASTPPADPNNQPPDDPNDPAQTGQGDQTAAARLMLEAKQVPSAALDAFAADIAKVVERQREAVTALVERSKALITLAPDRYKADQLWDSRKWNKELADAIEPHMRKAAHTAARKVDSSQPTDVMDNYIGVASANIASRWNDETADQLKGAVALGGESLGDNVANVFAVAMGYRAARLARTTATDMNGFGKVDTANRAGLSTKTWVTGPNPRDEHAAMDGETVAVSEPFSDGSMWPSGPNCNCDVDFSSEGN
jgi:HK97 family phage portal protein